MRGRGWCKRWLCFMLLAGLSGCVEPGDDAESGQPPAVQMSAPPAMTVPAEDSKVAALPPAPRPPDRPTTLPATAPSPELEPQSLKELDQEHALSLFGRPSEISEAAPATVWRYRRKGCQLDLFFYMDIQTHSFHVLTYEFRPDERSEAGQRACLNRLREASRAH